MKQNGSGSETRDDQAAGSAIDAEDRVWGGSGWISIAAGAAVVVVALHALWLEFDGCYRFFPSELRKTMSHILSLERSIDEQREGTGRPPASLTDLPDLTQIHGLALDDAGLPLDGWGNPLQYEVHGKGHTLYSHGRDGRPGGAGLDAELRRAPHGQMRWSGATFVQFITQMAPPGMIAACVLSGFLASGACYVLTRRRPSGKIGAIAMTAKVAVTVVVCLIAAGGMALLHFPSGH